MQNTTYLISTIITLLIVSILGINSNKKIKNSEDFSLGGRKFSSAQVAASIIGTLVGGASTVGTAQAAFVNGMSGIWYTLGAGLGCLFLGKFISKPLRESEVYTIPEFIDKFYGKKAKIASSIISSAAIFVHITGQILGTVAIAVTVFSISENIAIILTMFLIISYIFFGGFLGSSIVGRIKTYLLYVTLTFCLIIIIKKIGNANIFDLYNFSDNYFSIFSGGLFNSLALGFSLVIGVSSSQTYLQAIFSGKDAKTSQRGAFIAAALIPPIGLISTFIGIFMRINHPDIISSQAMPLFILNYINPVIGGIIIGTLIISLIGTGAGLTLGISTMLTRDIYKGIFRPFATDKMELLFSRIAVMIVSLLAVFMVFFNLDSLILKWAFLSMTLRGTVIFVPMVFGLIYKEKIPPKAGIVSIILAPIITIISTSYNLIKIDPLYLGMCTGISVFIYYLYIKPNFTK